MKVDKVQWQMITALVLVAVVAAGLLATTDIFTREPIAQAQREALRKALLQVLPQHVNDAQTDVIKLGKDKQQVKIYPARNAEKDVIGLAWEVIAPDGYSGTIKILVGVRPQGKVHAIRITFHRETPGLGDGIVDDFEWLGAFVGKGLEGTRWAVKKDGGEFDQFTGATITPRAVVKAVKGALEYYKTNQKLIADAIKAQDAKPEPVADVKQDATAKSAPKVAAKAAAKETAEVTKKAVSKAVPESAAKPAPKVSSEAAKKAVSKAVPESAKPAPKVSSEAAKKAVRKAVPESTAKPAPKVSFETAKEAVSKAVPESAAELVPEISTEAAKKAVSETVPASVPANTPPAAVKTNPVTEKISTGKKVGDGGGQ